MTVLGNDSNYLPYFSMGNETQLGKTQFSIYARCRWFVFNIYVMATGKMAAFSDLSRKTAHCPSCPPPCFILHSPLAHNLMYFLFSNINLLVISIYSFYVYFFSIFYCVFWMHYCIIADNIVTLMWQQIWYQTYWFVFLSYRVSMFHGKDIDNVSIGWVLTFLTLWLKTYDLINILWECGTMCMRSILTVFTKIFPASHLSQSGEELLRCFLVQAMYFNRG